MTASVLWLILTVLWAGLQFGIMFYLNHTHLLFTQQTLEDVGYDLSLIKPKTWQVSSLRSDLSSLIITIGP